MVAILARRFDDRDLAEDCLREAAAEALVHRALEMPNSTVLRSHLPAA